MDGDSSGRDETATQERMLLQIAIRNPQQVDVVVIRLGDVKEETAARDLRSLFTRERPYDKDFPTSLDKFGYQFHGEQ